MAVTSLKFLPPLRRPKNAKISKRSLACTSGTRLLSLILLKHCRVF